MMEIQNRPKQSDKTTAMLQVQIDQIARLFASGNDWVEIRYIGDVSKFRKSLYGAVRRRGLLWSFAVCDESLFVIK